MHNEEEPDLNGEEQFDDPGAAFDALRESVNGVGIKVGELQSQMNQMATEMQTALARLDPSEDLAWQLKHLQVIEMQGDQTLEVIDRYRSELPRLTETIGEHVTKLTDAARNLERTARGTSLRNRALVFFAGIIVAIITFTLWPKLFGSSVGGYLVDRDPWTAGSMIMHTARPEQWNEILSASKLVNLNIDVIRKCRVDAQSTNKDQRCAIIVKP